MMICAGVYGYTLMNSPDIITLGVGESYTLEPKDSEYSIRSYNADIISPASGNTVQATNIGEAVVCIKYTYFNREFFRFRVISAPTDITLSTSSLELGCGETYTLKAKCTSSDEDFAVSYKSSDEKVASVDENGNITANTVGECKIYASSYNGVSASCELTVLKAPSSFSLSEDDVTIGVGEQVTLEHVFADDEYSGSVKLTSSDDNIISVENNTITAVSTGACTVFARTHNGATSSCNLTVKKLPDTLTLLTLDKYDINADINIVTDIPSDCAVYNKEVSVSDESILRIDEDDPMLLHCVSTGEATITLTLSNGVSAKKTVTVGDYSGNTIDFDILNQFPTLPTGCEVVSLTSVLNHYGMDVSMTTMADEYMPRYDGAYYNIDPHEYFIGTPYTWDGFGCFSGCIVKTATNYFEDNNIDDYIAVDISGCSVDDIYNYLENDIPVITWVTSNFVTPSVNGSWYVDGKYIVWCNSEHCLVTTGYDKENGTVTVADDSGAYTYSVSMSQFENVFEGMGSMAVVILKK